MLHRQKVYVFFEFLKAEIFEGQRNGSSGRNKKNTTFSSSVPADPRGWSTGQNNEIGICTSTYQETSILILSVTKVEQQSDSKVVRFFPILLAPWLTFSPTTISCPLSQLAPDSTFVYVSSLYSTGEVI